MDFFDDLRQVITCEFDRAQLDVDTVGATLNFEVASVIHAPEFPIANVLLLARILTTAIEVNLKRKIR
jgi:hypothetical protein